MCVVRMHAQHPSSVLSIFSKLTSRLIQFRSQYQGNNMSYLLNTYPKVEKKSPHCTDPSIRRSEISSQPCYQKTLYRNDENRLKASILATKPVLLPNRANQTTRTQLLYLQHLPLERGYKTVIALKLLYKWQNRCIRYTLRQTQNNVSKHYVTPYINALFLFNMDLDSLNGRLVKLLSLYDLRRKKHIHTRGHWRDKIIKNSRILY